RRAQPDPARPLRPVRTRPTGAASVSDTHHRPKQDGRHRADPRHRRPRTGGVACGADRWCVRWVGVENWLSFSLELTNRLPEDDDERGGVAHLHYASTVART